jgi:hypothetical protein
MNNLQFWFTQLIKAEYNFYSDLLTYSEQYNPLCFEVRFLAFFTDKISSKGFKIAAYHRISEEDIRAIELACFNNLQPYKTILDVVNNSIVNVIEQVEQMSEKLNGYSLDRQTTKAMIYGT